MTHDKIDQENRDLDHLFQSYRTALPDPEASANFMPELWRKIEARQFFVLRLKKLSQVFVATAAAICLLLAIVLQAPVRSTVDRPGVAGNYVDVLANANPPENLSAVGIRIDYTEPNGK